MKQHISHHQPAPDAATALIGFTDLAQQTLADPKEAQLPLFVRSISPLPIMARATVVSPPFSVQTRFRSVLYREG